MTELAYAIAIVLVATLAHDVFRRYIAAITPKALTPDAEKRIAEQERLLDQANRAQAQLAKEWLVKFSELEAKWSQLEGHVDSKVAGTVAQLQQRGFGR